MTKKTDSVLLATSYATPADAIYAAAVADGVVSGIARFLNLKWGDDWSALDDKEIKPYKEQVYAAALVRKDELTPEQWYKREGDDNYILSDKAPQKEVADQYIKMSCSYAMSVSTQALNGIRSRPNYKALMQEWREDAQKYCSALFKKLKVECARQARGEAKRSKETHAAPMAQKVPDTFAALRKSNTFARDNRGDVSAMSDKAFDAGVAAFWDAASKVDGRRLGK